VQRLIGHAGEVTGLVLLPAQHIVWSSGTDNRICIWNTTTGQCQFCITPSSTKDNVAGATPAAPQQGAPVVGHQEAITALLSFEVAPGNTFILSSSLDTTVKAWNATTGECVASESHNEGVISMAIANDAQNHPLLLLGMESGSIVCRNLHATPKAAAFQLLFTLTDYHGCQHDGPVKCIAAGPSATFYTGGVDGKMNIFSFIGDLGLNQ